MSQCRNCRFWSDRIAQVIGGGPLEAMCLAEDGPYSGKYTTELVTCPSWRVNLYGAVDERAEEGDEPWRLYARDDEEAAAATAAAGR